jgi:hypothetical protein
MKGNFISGRESSMSMRSGRGCHCQGTEKIARLPAQLEQSKQRGECQDTFRKSGTYHVEPYKGFDFIIISAVRSHWKVIHISLAPERMAGVRGEQYEDEKSQSGGCGGY